MLLDAPVFRDAYHLEVVVVEIPEAAVLPYEWIYGDAKPPSIHGSGRRCQRTRASIELGGIEIL